LQQQLIFKNGAAFKGRLYNSVYFRYRKDTTGNLDEVQIENISKLQKEYEVIVKKKRSYFKIN
jgi:hypothetical protein